MERETNNNETRKRRLWRAVMFYSLLLVILLGSLLLIRSAMTPLNSWLEQYQTNQYQNTAEEIYKLLFADPDWALLYNMAGVENTKLEGQAQFAAYMEEKVGSRQLECVETPAGLSSHRCFSIRLDGEQIASFTMVPTEGNGWTLGTVEVFFTRSRSIDVTILPGQTVYINKILLDSSYTTLCVSTLAENYLEDDLHGLRYQVQTVTDLLTIPEITVLDTFGRPVELTQTGETSFTVEIPESDPITEAEYARVLETVKADALFALRQISISQLRQYFDPSGQAYNDLIQTEAEPIAIVGYTIQEDSLVIDDYYRYSEELFSVHAQITVDITDDTGAQHTLTTDVSYFFRPNQAGTYMAFLRTEEDLQQQVVTYPETEE